MSKLGAFSRGVQAGGALGANLAQLQMQSERQDWARYKQELEVEGNQLNALMNVATSQYNGDVTQMAKSPAGLNMMFDLMKNDPIISKQITSNEGWTPAGMYRDEDTGTYGIVVVNEDGERKPLTVDRASGSASFTLTEDDLLRTFAASAGRTGQKDTLSMNRALNLINGMEGVDKEQAKALLSAGSGGVDIPTAPSIQNVSRAARDNRASVDTHQIAYNTTNAPKTDPKSGTGDTEQVYAPDTEETPQLGVFGKAPTRTETQADYDAVDLAEADLAKKESEDAGIKAIQQGVGAGVLSENEGNDLIDIWGKGGLSAVGLENKLRGAMDRAQVVGQEPSPQDRTVAMNRLVSGGATTSDLAFEERGQAPAFGGQAYTDAPQTTVAPQAPSVDLGSIRGVGGVPPETREAAPSPTAEALGGQLGRLPAQTAIRTVAESIPEGTAEYIKSTGETAGAIYDAAVAGDTKKVGKLFGQDVAKAGKLASEFVTNMTTAAQEGWDGITGASSDLFASFSEGYSGEKARATEKIIDDKVKQVATEVDAPEKAKTEASRQRISTATANDPEKLANTTKVISAQTQSLTPGERVVKDRELFERAFTPAKKPSAKQKYAATYLMTSGMISEGAYRNYMVTGEWSNADRDLAQRELAFRHQYVKDQISLAKLQSKVGADGAKAAKTAFDQASGRSSPIVASAVFNSKSMAAGQEMSQEAANKYSSLLLDAYLDNPLLLGRMGVTNKYSLTPEQVNFVAENIATEVSNGTLVFQKPSKAEDSSLFSSRYWFGDDKEGINPLSQRDISSKVQGWFSKENK